MTRCCVLILLLPLFAGAQKFSAADLRQLKTFSTGAFSNDVQVKADTHFVNAGLTVQPIWQKRKDGIWMFTERVDTGHFFQVWHFYLQDDTTLILQLLDFKETQKAVQLSREIKQESNLYLYHLFTRHGCEVYLKRNKTGYAGDSFGKDCFSNVPGIEYLAYHIEVKKNTISWQEGGFDKEDKAIPAFFAGQYEFIRQVKSLK
ncbi:MAG: CpcT/CpeT family chromophore lyase [Chitinophagaceae bacterium]